MPVLAVIGWVSFPYHSIIYCCMIISTYRSSCYRNGMFVSSPVLLLNRFICGWSTGKVKDFTSAGANGPFNFLLAKSLYCTFSGIKKKQRCQIIVIIELPWIVYSLFIYYLCCLYAHCVVFICSDHMHIIFVCIIIKTLPGILSHFPARIRSCEAVIYWFMCAFHICDCCVVQIEPMTEDRMIKKGWIEERSVKCFI